MPPSVLRPCSSCSRFRRIGDVDCPHCGCAGPALGRTARAALVGLAIGGSVACMQEAKYGAAYTPELDTSEGQDTGDTGDTE